MATVEIEIPLDELIKTLEQLIAHIDLQKIEYNKLKNEILEPVVADLADLEAEFEQIIEPLQDYRKEIEKDIKSRIIERGQSLKGDNIHLIYSKPRVTWDTKGLEGYMVAHPEIEKFRRVGKGSGRIKYI